MYRPRTGRAVRFISYFLLCSVIISSGKTCVAETSFILVLLRRGLSTACGEHVLSPRSRYPGDSNYITPGSSFYTSGFLYVVFKAYLCILRERGREQGRGREREGERGRERIPSRLYTVSAEPDVGLDPMNCQITTSPDTPRVGGRAEAPLTLPSLWAPTEPAHHLGCGLRRRCCWLLNSLSH